MKIFPTSRADWLRTLIPLAMLGSAAGAWLAWHPGQILRSGAHDRGTNGVWMAHGWLAHDHWFMQNPERMAQLTVYHNTPSVIATLQDLRNKGMGDAFLDLHPCAAGGRLPAASHDSAATLALMARDLKIRTWAWVGGNRGETCFPEKPEWRRTFIADCRDFLAKCPQFQGMMINIEPWADNDPAMLTLLDELRQALPQGKQVAVAACPPPTLFQPNKKNHWTEPYFKQVAARSDLMAVMMYDTGLSNDKLFTSLIASWTEESLAWAAPTPVLLGVADYEEAEPQPWHHPKTENLANALAGVHAGLSSFDSLPANYRGVAVFANYTMNAAKWAVWEKEFCAKRPQIAVQKPPTLEELMKGGLARPNTDASPGKKVPPRKPLPVPYRNP